MLVPASPALPKVVLYCHNRYGLGHIMRSIRLAASLRDSGRFAPVLLTGCRRLDSLPLPVGVAVHQLTPVPADAWATDQYEVLAERATQIRACLQQVRPAVLLVDTLPLGYHNELRTALREATAAGTACVLGMPYLPTDWHSLLRQPAHRALLATYQLGLLYTDELRPAELADCPFPLERAGPVGGGEPAPSSPTSRTLVVANGGGTGSPELLALVLRATAALRQQGFQVRFIMGPLAPAPELYALAAAEPNLTLVPACPVEEAIGGARLVVARCGYNSASGLMRSGVPVVFVPYPGPEQLDRARRLAATPNVQLVEQHEPEAAARLEACLLVALAQLHTPRPPLADFDGAARVVSSLSQLLARQAADADVVS